MIPAILHDVNGSRADERVAFPAVPRVGDRVRPAFTDQMAYEVQSVSWDAAERWMPWSEAAMLARSMPASPLDSERAFVLVVNIVAIVLIPR